MKCTPTGSTTSQELLSSHPSPYSGSPIGQTVTWWTDTAVMIPLSIVSLAWDLFLLCLCVVTIPIVLVLFAFRDAASKLKLLKSKL